MPVASSIGMGNKLRPLVRTVADSWNPACLQSNLEAASSCPAAALVVPEMLESIGLQKGNRAKTNRQTIQPGTPNGWQNSKTAIGGVGPGEDLLVLTRVVFVFSPPFYLDHRISLSVLCQVGCQRHASHGDHGGGAEARLTRGLFGNADSLRLEPPQSPGHGCWETFCIFAYCGLVVEFQHHLTAKKQNAPLPTSTKW